MPDPTAIIADDHALIRQGIRQILVSAGLDVVAEAADGIEAIALARAHQPALMTLDIAMPYARGIEVFGEVRRWSPETKIIIFSGMTSVGLLQQLDEAEADGIFLKRGDLEPFSRSVPEILEGRRRVSAEVSELLSGSEGGVSMTARERQVLSMVAQGLSNKEIADRWGVSAKTVENHRTNIMRKIGANSVAGLIAYALREGLLETYRET